MAQTQNTGQDTVQITRRKFLELVAGSGVVAAITSTIMYFGLSGIFKEGSKQYTTNQTSHISKYEPRQETITTTYTQPPATKTVTKTETVTETTTKTVTETRTETLTKPSPTTTTTQRPITLEEIVFGNSDLEFVPLKVLDVKVVGGNAELYVESPLTEKKTKIKISKEYLSRGNINIEKIVSAVRKYNSDKKSNYSVYFVLGRANINEAIKHGDTWKPNAPRIYHSIIISKRDWKDVYNALKSVRSNEALVLMPTLYKGPYSDAFWGGSNQLKNKDDDSNSVIIIYQNKQQVDEATDLVELASYILGRPGDKNPSGSGILIVATIATANYKGTYDNGAPIVAVDKYKGTYIAFIPQKGNHLISNW